MNRNGTRFLSMLLAVVLILTASIPVYAKTTVSAKTVKKAYVSYLKKAVKKGTLPEDLDYNLYDFNKDGIKELVVGDPNGGRACMSVYTYQNSKVTKLISGETDIGYIEGKKYIVAYGSGGALNYGYNVYKISNGKLKKVSEYACVDGVFQKNGKTITEDKFKAFANTVVYDLGKNYKITKTIKAEKSGSAYQVGDDLYYSLTIWWTKSNEAGSLMKINTKTQKKEKIVSDSLNGKLTNGFSDITVKGKYIYVIWDHALGSDGDYEPYVYRISKDGKSMKKLALADSYTIAGSRIYYTKCEKVTEGDTDTVKECGLYSMKLDGSDKKQEKTTTISWTETKGYTSRSVTVSGKTYSVVVENGKCKLNCKNEKTGKSKTIYQFSGSYVGSFEVLEDAIILVQPLSNGYRKIVYMDLNGKNRITLKKSIAVG